MINVAVVDDEETVFRQIEEYFSRFSRETGERFNVRWFADALDFLDNYVFSDIVLMDIEMPHLNGMEAAEKLRKVDPRVALIFITNMVQYAVKGYAVNAIDYVLKPVNYARFSALIKKTIRIIGENNDTEIPLKVGGGVRKLYASSVVYVEIRDHLLVWHTESERIEVWDTLKNAQKLLPENFVRCNHANIVNLRYVDSVERDTVSLLQGKVVLTISLNKRKGFMAQLNRYMGLK